MASRESSLILKLVDDVSKPARSVEQALKQAENQIKDVAAQMSEGVAPTDRLVASIAKLGATRTDIEQVSRAWVDYTKAQGLAAESGNWTKEQIADVRSWETQTISSVRSVVRERDAETRAMRSAAAEQAEILRKQGLEQQTVLREQNRKREELSNQRRELARGVAGGLGGGIVGAVAGGEALEAIKRTAEAGMTLDQRKAQLKVSGASDADIAEAHQRYAAFSKSHAGVSEADWMASYKDARVNAPDDAQNATELFARYRSALRNSSLSTSEADISKIMSIMDELAIKKPDREKFLNSFTKAQQLFSDAQISPETYLAGTRTAKQSAYGWTPEFFEKVFPMYLQSFGENAGTAIETGYSNYVGHHMQKTEIEALLANGFLNPRDVKTDHGRTTIRDGAHAWGEELYKKNPYEFALQFHEKYMSNKGATESGYEDLLAKLPRNFAEIMAFPLEAKSRIERDKRSLGNPIGLAAADDAELAKNPSAAVDALKTSFEQLAASIAAPAVQAIAPTLVGMAQGVQTASNAIGGLNPNLVALGGGVAAIAGTAGALKALFGVGGGLFGGFGLSKSAGLLDSSAEQLMVAARMMQGENTLGGLGGHGPGRSPSTPSLRGRAGLAAGGAAALMAGAPNDDAAINEALNDNSKSIVGQAVAASVDALKRLADDARTALRGLEITRPVSHPGRDVHSPQTGPYSYTPAEAQVSVDTHAVDAAAAKIDALGNARPTVVIGVDSSAVDAAVSRIRNAAASVGAAVHGMPPSLSSVQRGNFSWGGISGE
jgi:hypothetical protein